MNEEDQKPTSTLAVAKDPVCGMPVDEGRGAHTVLHRETLYRFCSEGCRAEFLRYPDEYASSKPESGAEDV